jgi:2'-5' RNA ligase
MRLFAAIDPPPAERDRLLGWLESGRLSATDLRLTPSDQWHLTLAFYGETPGGAVADLSERLRRAARRGPELSLQLAGVGSFPSDPARARVMWLGVDGDLVELGRLADRCVAAGRRIGLDLETRKYRPHLTIGRPRRGEIDLRPALASLPPYRGEVWRATSLKLVRSHLGAAVRHEIVEEFGLG